MSQLTVRKTQQYQIHPDDLMFRYDANIKLPKGEPARLHVLTNINDDMRACEMLRERMKVLKASPEPPPDLPREVRGTYLYVGGT